MWMDSRTRDIPKLVRRGLLLVLSSPSGTGKTSIARGVLAADTDITLAVSYTTRPPRPGEVDGRDYHFVTKKTFDAMVANDEFLEHSCVYDHDYGTPRSSVERKLSKGGDVLLDVDWQGMSRIEAVAGEDMASVFILPPSVLELERRLVERATDSPEVIERRMKKAEEEISHCKDYQYLVLNSDLDNSVRSVLNILNAERLKRHRQQCICDVLQDQRD